GLQGAPEAGRRRQETRGPRLHRHADAGPHADVGARRMRTTNRRRFVAATLASVAAPAAWPLAARERVVIGQSAPLTGPVAGAFKGVLAGEKMAFEQVNRKGGVNGRP